jgi:prepilin-type N-terminal cleavage/methylation domain-containing protein
MKDIKRMGFTLLEVIITLVVVSIVAVMVASFSTNVGISANPTASLGRSADLQTGMANVSRAYYNLAQPITHASLDTFRTNLINNPGTYIAVSGVAVDTGRTGFINFDAGFTEVADGASNNLKVTLKNDYGQSVSTIFTTR